MQTGRFTRWQPASPVAAWYSFYLFHKNIHNVNVFVKKIEIFHPTGGETGLRIRHKDWNSPHRISRVI